jgi:hypothetical protein
MKYITNIDTLSALFDRLITENIKLYFFNKDNIIDKVNHQKIVVEEIKNRIKKLLQDTYEKKEYDYLSEKRTFNENSIVESLEELIVNDINIGESDRERLKQVQSENPSIEKFIVNEKRLRKANEGRSRNKNEIDDQYKKIIE